MRYRRRETDGGREERGGGKESRGKGRRERGGSVRREGGQEGGTVTCSKEGAQWNKMK